jgi:hypothetical protein
MFFAAEMKVLDRNLVAEFVRIRMETSASGGRQPTGFLAASASGGRQPTGFLAAGR